MPDRPRPQAPSDARNDGTTLRDIARAIELQQGGRLDEAEAIYAKLLAADDRDPTTLINAGALSLARNDVATSIARLEAASALVPANAIAHANLGLALIHAGRHADALAALDRAVAHRPDFAQAHNSRAIALMRLKRRDDARLAFERALALLPAYPEAAINLGELANQAGDAATARAAYQRVVSRDPSHPVARAGIAFADALEGRLDDSIAALEQVVTAHPDAAAVWQTLGAVRNWAWRHADAEAAYRASLALQPFNRDAQFGIASTLLARGRYEEGLTAFDASRARVPPPSALGHLPAWSGEALQGALVVHGEQGLGDVVQFARFLPALRGRVGRVVMLLEGYWAPLAPLMASLHGVDRVVTDASALGDERPVARVSVLALPGLAGAMPNRLPLPPYLAQPRDRRDTWQARIASLPGPRVGLAWSVFARDDHGYVTRHKSLSADELSPLLDVEGVNWVSLQPGQAGDPSLLGARAGRITATGTEIRDFGDTAALVEQLDLVIAPDTAVAHVAGALGKPVWLLERFHGCWRWRLEAGTTPWYPSLTIFRQSRFGDWTDAVSRVAAALADWRDALPSTRLPGHQ